MVRGRAFLRSRPRLAVTLLAVGLLAAVGLGGGVLGSSQPRSAHAKATPSAAPLPTGQRRGPFRVLRVMDGETLQVEEHAGRPTTVRLLGIDAPTLADQGLQTNCLAAAATRALTTMVGGRSVTLEIDPGQGGGRLTDRQLGNGTPGEDEPATQLAYVYTGQSLINQMLLEGGFVTEYADHPYRLQDQFRAAQQSARQKGLGVWSPERCATGAG